MRLQFYVGMALLSMLVVTGTTQAGAVQDLEAADKAYENGAIGEAIDRYTLVIASHELPGEAQSHALRRRGDAWYKKSFYQQAAADYDEAIHLNPSNVAAFVGRGNIFTQKLEYEDAIAAYSEAIRLNPRALIPLRYRGKAQYKLNHYVEAASDFAAAQRIQPNAYTAIDLFLARSWAEMPDAHAGLVADAKTLSNEWPRPVIDFYLGEISADDALARAMNEDPKIQKGRVCETDHFIAQLWEVQRNRHSVVVALEKAARDCG